MSEYPKKYQLTDIQEVGLLGEFEDHIDLSKDVSILRVRRRSIHIEKSVIVPQSPLVGIGLTN